MHICCMCFITVVVYFDTDALPHTNTPQRKNASSNCRKAEYETCLWLKTKDRQNQSPRRLAGKLWSFQIKIPKKLANRFDTTKQDRSFSTNWMKFIFLVQPYMLGTFCIFLRWKCPVSTSSPPCTFTVPFLVSTWTLWNPPPVCCPWNRSQWTPWVIYLIVLDLICSFWFRKSEYGFNLMC